MAARNLTRRDRENDFSAVGKIGRRTGVTLPQGRIDENGLEEITGIFSSPHKPSPLRRSTRVMPATGESRTSDASVEMTGMDNTGLTPTQVISARKSLRGASLPRSASPKKTGINGSARRSHGVGVLTLKDMAEMDDQDDENSLLLSPQRLIHTAVRRTSASPDKSPLRDITSPGTRSTKARPIAEFDVAHTDHESALEQEEPNVELHTAEHDSILVDYRREMDNEGIFDNGGVLLEDDIDHPPPAEGFDDEDVDQTFEPESDAPVDEPEVVKANSRKKRKSDTIEEARLAQSSPSQQVKKRKIGIKKRVGTEEPVQLVERPTATARSFKSTSSASRKPAASSKSIASASTLSRRQEAELENLVEKIRERPGQQKSLFILRRETPADDSVSHTRSGRVSVKPLAYWRNERCVYGGSPGGASLQGGARFPLNSIKEIIRTDEVGTATMKRGTSKHKGKGKSRARSQTHEEAGSDSEDLDVFDDPDAESWESSSGIFRGNVSVWDEERQAPFDAEEQVELAYAAAAIQTREVKGSSFRYSKLLSTTFFGTGIVELPPGGEKRPKNSRRMLMIFFVICGRVSVSVGPANGEQNTFSVGKGGFWQVPRGNQYAIANLLDKPARVFFSQGCEPAPSEEEE